MFELVKRVFAKKDKSAIDTMRAYQAVYKTEYGRYVLEDILRLCRYGETGLGKTTEETYFRLGEQNVGIEIAQRLNADILELEKIKEDEEQNVSD